MSELNGVRGCRLCMWKCDSSLLTAKLLPRVEDGEKPDVADTVGVI